MPPTQLIRRFLLDWFNSKPFFRVRTASMILVCVNALFALLTRIHHEIASLFVRSITKQLHHLPSLVKKTIQSLPLLLQTPL
jgi:hypothetical protein